MQIPIKDRYVAAQFAATAMATYSRDDGYTAFIPLIGIQSAAFCMTLVRKHKLSEAGYHLIYSFSLALAGPWTLLYWDLTRGNDHFGLAVIVAMMVVIIAVYLTHTRVGGWLERTQTLDWPQISN